MNNNLIYIRVFKKFLFFNELFRQIIHIFNKHQGNIESMQISLFHVIKIADEINKSSKIQIFFLLIHKTLYS